MKGMTNEQLRAAAPSIFSEHPISTASDKYAFIPTIRIIEELRQRGVYPVSANQSRTRLPNGEPFAKHVVRFRSQQHEQVNVGDVIQEAIVHNSHDTGSAFSTLAGLYRVWCGNGACTPIGEVAHYAVRHQGNVAHEAIDAVHRVIDDFPAVVERVAILDAVKLSPTEQIEFAARAADLRWDVPKVEPKLLNEARRSRDMGDSAWLTFNRIQENIVRGGVHYVAEGRDNRRVHRHTRAIKSAVADIDFNKRLWALALEYAQ